MEYIDLRSDTVTRPTREMITAMAGADAGDDVYGDDPTVNLLQELAAEKMGKEDSLFVPSGTFGNELAILTHADRGDEVIIAESNHIVQHEVGAPTFLAGVQLRLLNDNNGSINIREAEKLIRPPDIHFPKTGLICTENAHSNGTVLDLEEMEELYRLGKKYGVPVHLDGARIFNAATFLRVEAKQIAKNCDSVMFCLSKGLCSPIGSILCGTKKFISRARKYRKLMGGGMRQVGYIAASGIISLEKMTKRLREDHKLARYLAKKLEAVAFIKVLRERLDINMVFFKVRREGFNHQDFVNYMEKNRVKINPPLGGEYRFVTHYWINREDIDQTVDLILKYKTGE